MKRFWVLLVVMGVAGGWAAEVELRSSGRGLVFGGEEFGVTLDGESGWLKSVTCGGVVVVADGGRPQLFDVQGDSGWVTGGGARSSGEGVERVAADTLRSRLRAGEWRVDVYMQLLPAKRMLRRWFEIEWLGEVPTKIRGFWFQAGGCGLQGEGSYLVPVQYPPQRRAASELKAGRKSGSWQSPFAVLADPGGGWSAMWALDELPVYADRGSSGVEEQADGINVTQSFNMRGHVHKGAVQKVGDAWLWLVPRSVEEQLRQMPEWFETVGQVPPAGRPEWLKRVALYSMHPGGTTGSMCKDLGGFQAATKLLPHIEGLGCNAVWLMPVEDKSIYWPRDYYKLQEGIGTPDDYRAFVARAHELGMKVWQDCVPHGGGNTNARAKEHPEWLAQNEDGSTLHYWCFDFNWPTWIDYMRDVVGFYTREYQLDGFRIDACGGSKIPNWNPAIPYMRASHSQAQGGFAMQRALREAVREVNPDGANLAEVGESVHGAISDSTYDFALCYQVLHDFRKVPAEVFVGRLQRWLHEQQYAQIPDLVRMRHIESHDSLRSTLLYGAEAQRALFALSAWIHGIPMVYQEMEDGHYDAIRRVLHVRRHAAELNMGDADYLGVAAPAGVFACLRFGRLPAKGGAAWHDDYAWDAGSGDGERASVVVVNLNGHAITGEVVLPEGMGKYSEARDLMSGERMTVRDGKVVIAGMAPFGYTVLRLGAAPHWRVAAPLVVAGKSQEVGVVSEGQIEVGSVVVDSKSGFVTGVKRAGKVIPVELDLALPEEVAALGGGVKVKKTEGGVDVARRVGDGVLRLHYQAQAEGGVQVQAVWEAVKVKDRAALVMRLPEAATWFAECAEGRFESPFRVRHPEFEGIMGSIYRLPQGTSVLWDSRLHPFGLAEGRSSVGGGGVSVEFQSLPDMVQLWDRVGEVDGLHMALQWSRRAAIGFVLGGDRKEALQKADNTVCREGELSVVAVGGGWLVENTHYRLRLARTGEVMEYAQRRGEEWLTIMRGSHFYTDRGYGGDKRYSQQHEVETFMRFDRGVTGRLRMVFSGDLRGSYRFDKMAHPVEFCCAYEFGNEEAFRVEHAIKLGAAPQQGRGYLALLSPLTDVRQVTWFGEGENTASSERKSGRYVQSRESGWLPVSAEIELVNGARLVLGDIQWLGDAPANVFMHESQLHMAWIDGEQMVRPGVWHGVSMSVSGDNRVAARSHSGIIHGEQTESGSVLRDGDFESVGGHKMRLVTRGTMFDAISERAQVAAWSLPEGGKRVVEDGNWHMYIVGKQDEYRLVQQSLAAGVFKSGERWQLSARMKGRGVLRAHPEWKSGCLRWSIAADGKRQYKSVSLPFGDSDWREYTVEIVVPDKLESLAVEAGLNGNAGELWIDDVRLERLN